LAVSDVVGDDLSVIGSGPGVPDPSTWQDALEAYRQWTPAEQRVPHVEALLEKGAAGALAETPKAGDAAFARSTACVIGGRADAMRGAREAAERLGYHVIVIDEAITGEARVAAQDWLGRMHDIAGAPAGRLCVLSSGETTVRVIGAGRGGRNQEFALAAAEGLANWNGAVALASAGTDGIDGPTDAAGAIADSTTIARAQALNLQPPDHYLNANDSYTFFHALGDLVQTGRTDTNVGDLQVLLFAPTSTTSDA
jgi:hydroxypyruvate reductase